MDPQTSNNQQTSSPQQAQPLKQEKKGFNIKTPSISVPEGIKKMGKSNAKNIAPLLVIGLLVISAGVGTGWFLSGGSKGKVLGNGSEAAPGAKQTETEAGIADEETFRDSAEGTLESGGIEGEGTHHLVREGGESQTVYLTSTVIDLESFVGKKVKVWGETITARQAGWLMDVGKVKVVE